MKITPNVASVKVHSCPYHDTKVSEEYSLFPNTCYDLSVKASSGLRRYKLDPRYLRRVSKGPNECIIHTYVREGWTENSSSNKTTPLFLLCNTRLCQTTLLPTGEFVRNTSAGAILCTDNTENKLFVSSYMAPESQLNGYYVFTNHSIVRDNLKNWI